MATPRPILASTVRPPGEGEPLGVGAVLVPASAVLVPVSAVEELVVERREGLVAAVDAVTAVLD